MRMRDALGGDIAGNNMRHVTQYGSRFARFGKHSMPPYSTDNSPILTK
jgi:hypothetical protein